MDNFKKCPYFVRKTGGYYYGFKCKKHDAGLDIIYVNEKNIGSLHSGNFDKKLRDEYINTNCYKDFKNCTLYKKPFNSNFI